MSLSEWFTGIDTSQWATNTNPWTIEHLYLFVGIFFIVLFYGRILTLRERGEL